MPRYGRPHRRVRERHAREIALGIVMCARCGEPIDPREPWDLGHDDLNPAEYAGPEHVKCNRGTAGRGAAEIAAERAHRAEQDVVVPSGLRWSRHWGGSDTYEKWCSECRRQGSACGTVRTTNKGSQ